MKFTTKSGCLVLFVAVLTLLPLSVQAGTLYGITLNGYNSSSPGSSSLYRIDPETGTGTFIGALEYGVTSIAVDPATGLIYGVGTSLNGDFEGLLSIDPMTGSATEVGEGGGTSFETIGGFTFNSAGQLYGWNDITRRGRLVEIDISTGSAATIYAYYLSTVTPIMAFDNSDTLILINGTLVYRVNTTNSWTVNIGSLSISPGNGSGDFDPATDLLWAPVDSEDGSGSDIRVTDIALDSSFVIGTDIPYLQALAFDAMEADIDSDGDGILDSEDFCPETPADVYVDYEGCSGEQAVDMECPCDSEWKNHGEYIKCVAHSAKDQLTDGLISLEEMETIVSTRAQGDCGKRK